ncbi:hypothetical protein [Lactobacillus amylovorus]|nr:hypothetical protein [Lactobacillus amylovorus]
MTEENPNRPHTVKAIEIMTIHLTAIFLIKCGLNKDEITVIKEIVIEI